jgi:hypothetical protein
METLCRARVKRDREKYNPVFGVERKKWPGGLRSYSDKMDFYMACINFPGFSRDRSSSQDVLQTHVRPSLSLG